MEKYQRAMIKYYLGEWGRMIRTDGRMPMYAATPLASLQRRSIEDIATVSDETMDRMFRVMGQIKRIYPRLYCFQWDVYVKQLRVVVIAGTQACSERYIYHWLKRGEEYVGVGLGADFVAHDAIVALHECYQKKQANQLKTEKNVALADQQTQVFSMSIVRNV